MDMKEVKAVLAIIKESKQLTVGLKVSIGSPSPESKMIEDEIVPYLRSKQRAMTIQLFLVAVRILWTKSTWQNLIRFW